MNCNENFSKRNYTIEDLENILDAIPNPICTKNEDGIYTYVNKAFSKIMNLSKENIIGKNDFDFDNVNATAFDNNHKENLKNNTPTLSENEVTIKGEKKCFETYKTILNKYEDNTKYIMSISNEITAYKCIDENTQCELENNFDNTLISNNKTHNLYGKHLALNQITYEEFINKEFYNKTFKDRFSKITNAMSNKLKTNNIDLFLYNPETSKLNLYVKAYNNNDSVNVKHSYILSKEDKKFLLSQNSHENFNLFQKDIKNSSLSIETYPLTYGDELIAILNIYSADNNFCRLFQKNFIKSTCGKLNILIKSKIFFGEFKLSIEKRNSLEDKLELFLNTATDLYALINYDSTYLKVNPNWTSTLGWTEEELTNMKFQDLIHPDDLELTLKTSQSASDLKQYKGSGLLNRYRCKNGEYKVIEWNWSFFPNAHYVILTGKDKTEQHLLQKEKLQLEKAMELETLRTSFFANVSHEFRTPINIILTSIQLMIMNFNNSPTSKLNDKMIEYSKVIKQNSYRLLKLVNNLLDMTKIDEGYYELKLIKCNIVNLIEEIVLSVANHIGSKKRTIIFDTTEEEIITSCDPEKIETIILNLLSNSVKFTDEYNSIEVNLTLDKNNKKVIVSVKDDGVAIDKDFAKTIFERFTQVDNLLNRRCEGSGLGLALVKSFVDLHGGEIWVNTDYTDGAEIMFTLPIIESENPNHTNFQSKVLNANIERFNVEFSDIYNI